MAREFIIAENAGFCFGVKRAVDMAMDHNSSPESNRTYTLGPLIHNNDVITRLKESEINSLQEEDMDKLSSADSIVIRSHGTTPDVLKKLKKTGAKLLDATCPYVSSIQKKAKKFYELGYQIIIVGDKNHPEVIGINGWCDHTAIITKDGSDLRNLPPKVCVVSQTTERLLNYDKVVEIASQQCEDILAFNTICKATTKRQTSAEEVSSKVDLMIVIGGRESSNSRKLYEICRSNCPNTLFIENSSELNMNSLLDNDIQKIGITAGASTPDWVIQDVIQKLNSINL